MRRAAPVAILALGVVLVLHGCGYSTDSLMPEGVRTVAVELTANETFYREDEFLFTKLFGEELARRADVRLSDRRHAEAIITSRILGMTRVPLVIDSNRQTLNEGLIGEIEVVMTDRSTGRELTKFRLKRRTETITPRHETLDDNRQALMRELARDAAIELEKQSFLTLRTAPH